LKKKSHDFLYNVVQPKKKKKNEEVQFKKKGNKLGKLFHFFFHLAVPGENQ